MDNNKHRPQLSDFDPTVMVYNGEYHVGSPCSYSYEYLQYVQPTSQYHTGTFIYKITRVDPRVDTPYDKRVMSRVVGIYSNNQYLLMITNAEKFWNKYVEPRIQELEEAKENFIKYQEEKENESSI